MLFVRGCDIISAGGRDGPHGNNDFFPLFARVQEGIIDLLGCDHPAAGAIDTDNDRLYGRLITIIGNFLDK